MSMRNLAMLFTAVLLAAACGFGLCAITGWKIHPRELIVAFIICLIASVLALAPLTFARGGTQASVSQAALAGTLIHLMISLLIAAIVILSKLMQQAFTYWLLVFYWVTLLCLVMAMLRSIRAAPVQRIEQP